MRKAFENTSFEQLDFNVGTDSVKFYKVETNKYKIVEAIGGLDRTAEFDAT